LRAFLAVAAIAAYFLAMAWSGLQSGFSHDDLMNLTFALRDGWYKILRGNILFFSSQHRPLGSLYYLGIYDLFGFHSLPFRIVGIAALAVNTYLLYRLTKLVARSVEAGLYAALIICWHGNFGPLFFGSGNIYDVLGFGFYVATLAVYFAARQKGHLTVRDLVTLAVLQICAFNSKEFSATIPALLFCLELVFHHRKIVWRGVALSGILSAVFAAGKVLGPESLTSQSAYALRLSVDAWMASLTVFLNDLSYRTNWASTAIAIWFVVILVAAPLVLRNRAMLFGAAVTLLAPLPVMLIAPRGLASHYVTVGGLALWSSALLVDLRERLSKAIHASDWELRYLQAAAFSSLFVWVLVTHATQLSCQSEVFWKDGRSIARAIASMRRHPEWWASRNAPILVVSDPLEGQHWASIFIGMLCARNPELSIHRLPSIDPKPSAEDLRKYGLYIHWNGSEFVQTTADAIPH